jgi:superfamily II DNA or RNA helicase
VSLAELLTTVREDADPRAWAAAVSLAREGAVAGVGGDGTEVILQVKTKARPSPFEVHLWPDEGDYGCECELAAPCVHVCASLISLNQGLKVGRALPEAAPSFRVNLRYDFTTDGARLRVIRTVVWPDGRTEPLRGNLIDSNYAAGRGDVHVENLLVNHRGGPLDEEILRRLLLFLEGSPMGTLDGEPVRLSNEPVPFVIRVRDEGEGFRVGLFRATGLDKLYLGAALRGGVLHPTTFAELPAAERKALDPRTTDRVFSRDRVSWIVAEYLPRLRQFGLPVEIETERLPASDALQPRVMVELEDAPDGLRVRPVIVYGDPPVARIEDGHVVKLGAIVPARDHASERRATRAFEERTRLPVGFARVLSPAEAATFLRDDLHAALGVQVVGKVDRRRYRVSDATIIPHVAVARTAPVGESPAAFSLDVRFTSSEGEADPTEVLRAWHLGRSLVPLTDGGWAPLPAAWLKEHGAVLEELLAARDAAGRVDRNSTAALIELLEDTSANVPPDLASLREWLESGEGLPEIDPPATFKADLRPYQLTGYRWLAFLRKTGLHGILADDMGLGKTIQALAAIQDAGGRSLVIAPTSVLRNWAREAERFAPDLRVCVYHGTSRRLDPKANLTITSYALLRLDLEALTKVEWTYAILDEAQAIKNPDSQTALASGKLRALHRLCLSGTPVENRLEELWSLFRFLMPGLLGPRATFRERFERPIEGGDARAREGLRKRVRPYVLRRHKRQVATDLPPLTEVIEVCEMGAEQRRVYEAVRQAARRDVWLALSDRGNPGWQMQILEALLRMRQACCDPSLLPGLAGRNAPSAKLDRLEEVLVDLVVDGHKTLIFSQWTSLLDRVEPRLKTLGIDFVRLDGTTRDRQSVVDKFQSADGPPVFLVSLKAGGTGLNLTAADYVVHLDPWWNPAVEQQATDRAHRIGQDKPVVAMRFVCENSVEERILDLQDAKRALADAALGGEGGMMKALSAEELRSLFEGA